MASTVFNAFKKILEILEISASRITMVLEQVERILTTVVMIPGWFHIITSISMFLIEETIPYRCNRCAERRIQQTAEA